MISNAVCCSLMIVRCQITSAGSMATRIPASCGQGGASLRRAMSQAMSALSTAITACAAPTPTA
jgi:hypothetical protein